MAEVPVGVPSSGVTPRPKTPPKTTAAGEVTRKKLKERALAEPPPVFVGGSINSYSYTSSLGNSNHSLQSNDGNEMLDLTGGRHAIHRAFEDNASHRATQHLESSPQHADTNDVNPSLAGSSDFWSAAEQRSSMIREIEDERRRRRLASPHASTLGAEEWNHPEDENAPQRTWRLFAPDDKPCRYCKGREIECYGVEDDLLGRCTNCRRMMQECRFVYPSKNATYISAASHQHPTAAVSTPQTPIPRPHSTLHRPLPPMDPQPLPEPRDADIAAVLVTPDAPCVNMSAQDVEKSDQQSSNTTLDLETTSIPTVTSSSLRYTPPTSSSRNPDRPSRSPRNAANVRNMPSDQSYDQVYHTLSSLAPNAPQKPYRDPLPLPVPRLDRKAKHGSRHPMFDLRFKRSRVEGLNRDILGKNDSVETDVGRVTFEDDYDGPPFWSHELHDLPHRH